MLNQTHFEVIQHVYFIYAAKNLGVIFLMILHLTRLKNVSDIYI